MIGSVLASVPKTYPIRAARSLLMSTDRILITGASGMVGSLLARRLAEAGHNIRAMVRSAHRQPPLEGLDVELYQADLAEPESLPPALAGIDVVVHTAAHLGDWGPAEKFWAINVLALEHLLTAAYRKSRLRRWIQISSLGIYPARHHDGTDETVPPDLHGLDGYTRTKAEAEVLLGRHMDAYGLPAVILRPGFMYGPGDRNVVPRVIERIAAGQMKLVGSGQKVLNNTYVGNLVDAIVLALEKDEALGQTFNIRDERLVTREEFVNTIADYMGKPHPGRVPQWLARASVGFIEGFARARGATTAPLLTRARIKFLTLNLDFSIEKARRLLGYQPRVDFREGIGEALRWAQAQNMIPGLPPEPAAP
jgi:nucleoside-diphosphate-sugar epimerase